MTRWHPCVCHCCCHNSTSSVVTTTSCVYSFQILKPPANYNPIRTPARKLTATPTPMGMSGFRFQMDDDKVKIVDDLQPTGAGKQELPYMKMEDTQYFSKVCEIWTANYTLCTLCVLK